jgi:hypothetical protein
LTLGRIAGAVAILALVVPPAGAGERGGLVGFVQDARGTPVAGAVVSLFGQVAGGISLVTVTDEAGRFALASLPPGSYTLRAVRRGLASASRVRVQADRDATFRLSLPALADGLAPEAADSSRELAWLIRHKRRSVLESAHEEAGLQRADFRPSAPSAPDLLAALGGRVEFVTQPTRPGGGGLVPGLELDSAGVLRLEGRLSPSTRWSVGGLLAESETRSWRTAAEFVVEIGEGHEVLLGMGYGASFARPGESRSLAPDRTVGALLLQDEVRLGDRLSATVGARFSRLGFVEDANHFDPSLALEWKRDQRARLQVRGSARTLAPGGDLLTLSSLSPAPSLAYAAMRPGLRPERLGQWELALEEEVGGTTLVARAFFERVRDRLANTFDPTGASLSIRNAGHTRAHGFGVSVGRKIGRRTEGSVSYAQGHTARTGPRPHLPAGPASALDEADFHDLVARFETAIEPTDTRLRAYYRLNRLAPGGDQEPVFGSRFDVQVSQGLPFLGGLTRADWDLLIAVRNMYYEPWEGGVLDEFAVVNPPRRVLGGIAVKF